MGKREEQKVKRRMEILEAALRIFVKKGYAAAQIKDIAAEAGMSAGLMFHYFESKEKLYEELILYGLSKTQDAMSLETADPLEFFEECASQVLRAAREQPSVTLMFVFMAQAQRSEGIPEAAKKLAAGVNNINECVPLIEAGQKTGTIRQGDALALSNAFWCSLQGIMEQAAMHPELPLPEAEWLADILRIKGTEI